MTLSLSCARVQIAVGDDGTGIKTWEGTVRNEMSGNGRDGERTDDDGHGNDDGVPVPVKDRVQRHRASLEAKQRRRLEVCISIHLVDKVGKIAQWREKSI